MAIQSTELVVHETGSRAAELVFGSIDGLFSVLGIIAAGSTELVPVQIFTTGLGGAVAGALSVFAATYLSETTEKKTRLLEAMEQANRQRTRRVNSSSKRKPAPLTTSHPRVHHLLGRISRRALMSGIVTAFTSALASLVLLLPLVLLPIEYAVNSSIVIGVLLLLLLGGFRGVALKQSAAKSALKMVVLGIIVILASKSIGGFVLRLVSNA